MFGDLFGKLILYLHGEHLGFRAKSASLSINGAKRNTPSIVGVVVVQILRVVGDVAIAFGPGCIVHLSKVSEECREIRDFKLVLNRLIQDLLTV